MNCKHCGKELAEGATECPSCGKKVKRGGTALGICAVVFSLLPIVGFILGIITVVKSAKNKNKTALILGIVAIVLSIIIQICYIVLK